MAELIHTTIEDDDSEDNEDKNAPKRIDPKKLVNIPFVKPPETEMRATAEDLKRTVEFIPPVFGETRASILPDAEKAPDDDDEEEGEESKEETVAEAVEAGAAPESEEAAPTTTSEMQELAAEEMAHLREESTPAAAAPEATYVEPAAGEQEAEEPPAAPTGGSATPPPPRPPSSPGFFGRPEPSPVFRPSFEAPQESRPAPSSYSYERPAVEMRDLDRHTEEERKRNLRLVVVAGVATGLLLKAYIDGKTKSYKEMLEPLKDMAVDMLTSHKRTDARVEKVEQKVDKISQPIPTESLPAIQQPQEQIFDMEGNPITLQPGWHVERSSGGYSVVLDRHNRVVYDAIQYGEAFKRDQKREQLDPDIYGTVDGGAHSAGAPPASEFLASLPPALGGQTPELTPESTTPEEYKHPVETEHRPAGQHSLLTAISVPWLLTAIAVLLIIYFVAALS